ncbi:putative [Leishmania donovani]|nr:putative [Leishmania donovani]
MRARRTAKLLVHEEEHRLLIRFATALEMIIDDGGVEQQRQQQPYHQGK